VLLIIDQQSPDRLEALSDRRLDSVLARLLAPSLDRKLAAGCPPESHRLLATRAQALVAPGVRRSLARTFEEVLEMGGRPRRTRDRRISPCRDRVLAAESDLRDLIASLTVPLPLPARGVAMATSLLRDGTGPLYNPSSPSDLGSVVRAAVAALDPSLKLVVTG
jgi:hypothetical protein